MKRTSINIENKIIAGYMNKKNIPELSVMFNLGKSTIHRVLKRNNIKTRSVSEAQRDKNIVHGFFSKESLESCYWAGFFAADGCLHKANGRTYVVSIIQHLNELRHLEKYAKAINFCGKITTGINKTAYGEAKWARMQFASKEMFGDLSNNFNIVENKSLVLEPPLLEQEEHISNFIRGYFDGDGYILSKKYWTIGFTGTKAMLKWIRKQLQDGCLAHNPSIKKERSGTDTYKLVFCGKKQTPKIIKWLYVNSTEDTRLERKYKISLNYLR